MIYEYYISIIVYLGSSIYLEKLTKAFESNAALFFR